MSQDCENYDDYILNTLKEKEIVLTDLTYLLTKTNITYFYKFAIKHYTEIFSNLNDHIYYLGELNEHYRNKYSYLSEYDNLKFEDENIKTKNAYKYTFENNISYETNGTSHRDYLTKFLRMQMNNHIIKLINVENKKDNCLEDDFNNLSIYEKENIINKKNEVAFPDKFNNSINQNNSFISNTSKNLNINNSTINNNTLAIIDGTEIKLSESLSNCQKLILIAGFCASELSQKFDGKVFKSIKNTGMKKRVNNFLILI